MSVIYMNIFYLLLFCSSGISDVSQLSPGTNTTQPLNQVKSLVKVPSQGSSRVNDLLHRILFVNNLKALNNIKKMIVRIDASKEAEANQRIVQSLIQHISPQLLTNELLEKVGFVLSLDPTQAPTMVNVLIQKLFLEPPSQNSQKLRQRIIGDIGNMNEVQKMNLVRMIQGDKQVLNNSQKHEIQIWYPLRPLLERLEPQQEGKKALVANVLTHNVIRDGKKEPFLPRDVVGNVVSYLPGSGQDLTAEEIYQIHQDRTSAEVEARMKYQAERRLFVAAGNPKEAFEEAFKKKYGDKAFDPWFEDREE